MNQALLLFKSAEVLIISPAEREEPSLDDGTVKPAATNVSFKKKKASAPLPGDNDAEKI